MKTLHATQAGLLLLFSLIVDSLSAQGFGEIRGRIKNTNLEVVPYATVKVVQGSLLVGGTQSDENGNYAYKPLTPGSYEVIVMETGHLTQQVNKVKVIPNDATYLDFNLSPNMLGTVTVTAPPKNYIQAGVDRNMYSVMSIDGKELGQMGGYTPGDIQGAIPTLLSNVIQDGDGLHFRGSRGDASSNYVDGVKLLSQVSVPSMCIENLTIFSGGVPAMYGDLVGGLVVVTTKSYFSGIRDKNLRNAEAREQAEEDRRQKRAEQAAQNRQKEIEAEKEKDKTGK